MMSFEQELQTLEKKELRRSLRLVETAQGARITVDGTSVLNLCSNNYLGFADDERLKDAAIEAIKQYGVGSGASRLVCGTMKLHRALEEKLTEFKKTEACLVFNSGYTANVGIISALVKRGDIVFCDRLNHASIIDGIILSRAELRRYPHRDVNALAEMLEKTTCSGRRLIVTDSVFSMDGDIAPLKELCELSKKHNCLLMIDEAHATGVLGENGRGALEHCGLEDKKDTIIQMGTFSKALGGFGAYVCARQDIIDYLINHSRAFIYTTSLPPSIAAANIKALEIIQDESYLRQRLHENIELVRRSLRGFGFEIASDPTPIIPLMTKEPDVTMEFSKRLFEKGFFVQGIRPPTVAQGQCRLRLTVMATHRHKELERALESIQTIGRELCLL